MSSASNLAHLAEHESSLKSPAAPVEVALPPGVDPEVLDMRSPDDRRAFQGLDATISELAVSEDWESRIRLHTAAASLDEAAEAKPDEETRSAALRHYIRGREAALQSRHLVAVNELRQALELDPTSPAVMRELARNFLALGNQPRAMELFAKLLALDSQDSEALFTLALAAVNRREFALAAETLARRFVTGQSFTHDPAADLLAHFTLAASFRQLGYDRASIEAGILAADVPPEWTEQSIYSQRVGAVYRQRGEIWRHIGDAWCRLGRFDRALEAYASSAKLPASAPASLHPRVIYTNLRLGRPYTAQYELLQAIRNDAPNVSDRDIRLAGYLVSNTGETELLAQTVLDLHRESPGSSSLVRTAASLLPPEDARSILREFVDRRPRDEEAVAELFAWLGERHRAAAVDLAVALSATHPDLANTYSRRLLFAVPEPAALLADASKHLERPAGVQVYARLLTMLGAEGDAWAQASAAHRQWPENPGLMWLLIDLAAVLEEPMLLDQIAQRASEFSDVTTPLIMSRSHRALGQPEKAVEAAERALDRAERDEGNENDLRTAQLELSRAYAVYASSFNDEQNRRSWADESATLAQRVLDAEPANEAAHEILLSLYGPNGILSDADRFRQAARHLYNNAPDSRLYARIVAEEALNQGRFDQAIERLINLYDSDPSDVNALGMLIAAWTRQDRLDAAEEWLRYRRASRPHDPALLEQWINTQLAADRTEEAIEQLQSARSSNPDRPDVARLLERVYRSADRADDALALGEDRLKSRPRGVRRDIELAALYGGAGREAEALEHLKWVAGRLEYATLDNLLTAIALLGRLESLGDERDELTLTYVNVTVDRHPASPLQVYAAGLRSLSRLGRLDASFDALAEQAARESRGASEASSEAALVWRDLTQAFIDDGHAAAAARALRARILSDQPLEPQALSLLTTFAIVADAVSPPADSRGARTISLLEQLAAQGRTPQLLGMDGEPTLAEALLHASRVSSVLGDDAATEQILRRVIELRPDDSLALNNLGYMRLEQGHDDPQTIEWIERAFSLARDESNVQDTIGWLRYKQGRLTDDDRGEGALTLIERSRDSGEEPSSEVLDHLGDVHWRLGRRERAVEHWNEALGILADSNYRRTLEQNFHLLQTRGWGLVVAEPSAIFDRLFGPQLDALRDKLEAVEAGREPDVAPTFAEVDDDEPGA